MDDAATVLPDGVVYITDGRITHVQPASNPPPEGYAHGVVLETKGTVYPGLIELHNHLSYNVLQLWQVPHAFGNRGEWSTGPDYRRMISGPMDVVGKTPSLVPSLVRFVEAKCLLGGVTTSQGIALYSDAGIRRYYQGVIRNVEEPDSPDLKPAQSRIPDIAASDVTHFAQQLAKDNRLLLHLAEGVDKTAWQHFTALQLPNNAGWAITPHLVGIHSVGLHPEDIPIFASLGASMVWSPLSNLLLYGATADVAAMKAHGVAIGLGSDWSPSGSKNLLGELKVARLYSQNAADGPIFTDQELVQMATRTAAEILTWQQRLGTLEPGKLADLLVVEASDGDPYSTLIDATERDLALVMIGGIAAAGNPDLVTPFNPHPETVTVGGAQKACNFDLPDAEATVKTITLAAAQATLTAALADLPNLVAKLPKAAVAPDAAPAAAEPIPGTLALDEIEHTGCHLRTTPPDGVHVIPPAAVVEAEPPLADVLQPLTLDGLTAIDDTTMMGTLKAETNLPDYLRSGIPKAYAHT